LTIGAVDRSIDRVGNWELVNSGASMKTYYLLDKAHGRIFEELSDDGKHYFKEAAITPLR